MRERDRGVPSLKAMSEIARALCLCLLFVSRASAQDPALASAPTPSAASVSTQDVEPEGYRQAVDEAVREFAARNFEEARSLFARADALYPNARTQRGLGLADQQPRLITQRCIA